MTGSFDSNNINCPKCLSQVPVRSSQAGSRIECPSCGVSLAIPESFASQGMFDDLFDEPEPPTPTVQSGTEPEKKIDHESAEQLGIQIGSDVEPSSPNQDGSIEVSNATTAQEKESDEAPLVIGSSVAFDPVVAAEDVPVDVVDASPQDPFEYNEDKAIRVEGISPDIIAPDAFYFRCPVCNSEMHAIEKEIGNKVVCSDCHSQVTVIKPETRGHHDPWRQAAKMKTTESSDDLKLEEPVPRPQIDIGEDFGLDAVNDDLLAPRQVEADELSASPGQKRRQSTRQKPKSNRSNTTTKPHNNRPPTGSRKQTRNDSNTEQAAKKSGRAETDAVHQKPDDSQPSAVQLTQILKLDLFRDLDLMIRTIVTIVFLTLCYAMFDSVWNTLAMTDLPGSERFVRYFPAAIGCFFCFVVVCWFLSVSMSVLMRTIANGDQKVLEWVGFAPSEWMGSFMAFAFAAWASTIPGGLIGYVLMKLSGVFPFLPIGIAISMFAILPVLLMSSFYNESVFNIFAPEILQTTSPRAGEWKNAYFSYAIVLAAFVLGTMILFIPGLLFCFVGATIQVIALTAFAVMIGLHARAIIPAINT